MRILKGIFAVFMGAAIIYVQLVESRPAPCFSAECLGFNVAWLAIFSFGVYAFWRGVKMLRGRDQSVDVRPETTITESSDSPPPFANKPLDRG